MLCIEPLVPHFTSKDNEYFAKNRHLKILILCKNRHQRQFLMKICFCNTQDNLRKTCAIVCFRITAIGSLGANTEGKSWCVLAFLEFEI